MPLDVRAIAVKTAVVGFFVLSLVQVFAGFSPFVCCKRAGIGAAIIYLVTALAVKAVNAIITDAIIKKQVRRHREQNSAY